MSNQENFSITFDGPALEQSAMSAVVLAQALIALDGLARKAAEAAYGRDADIEVKVKGGFRPGSFITDLTIQSGFSFSEALAGGASATTILAGVINIGKWARGRKVVSESEPDASGKVRVRNNSGQVSVFNECVINVYNNPRTASQLSRLTQPLEMEGVESLALSSDSEDVPTETVTRDERCFFRQGEGVVLTDNETEVILYVVGPMLNGSPRGWRFADEEDGVEFTAAVEDEAFLASVRERRQTMENGTSILAVLRTVQRKVQRTRTERTIVEVKAVYPPGEDV